MNALLQAGLGGRVPAPPEKRFLTGGSTDANPAVPVRCPGLSRRWLRRLRGYIKQRQLVVQFTDHCNATCPQCSMRASSRFSRSRLALAELQDIVSTAAAQGYSALSLTGGEPFLHMDDLFSLLHHAGSQGIPYLRTGTNGFFLRVEDSPEGLAQIWRVAGRLAATPVRNFWISLDSYLPETHETMRGLPGVVEAIRKALPVFHSLGLYPSANLGINRHLGGSATRDLGPGQFPDEREYARAFLAAYREAFGNFFQSAAGMGFTLANVCYPMSLDMEASDIRDRLPYAAASADRMVRFSSREKSWLFQALDEAIVKHRHLLRLFTPRCSLYALRKQYAGEPEYPAACQGGKSFFFIDARSGDTHPCGYRSGESLGRWQDQPLSRVQARDCRDCDWECFRDPSELLSPLQDFFRHPWRLPKRLLTQREYFKLWLEDWRYYLACDFFDGRQAPKPDRLSRFQPAARTQK